MTRAAQGHAAMLLFSVLVAGSFSLGGMAANLIDPGALTAVRFVIGSILVGAVAIATTGVRRSHFSAPWRYILLGAMMALYFALMFEGLKTAPPVSVAAVFTLTPVISAIAGYVLLRQVTTRHMSLALFLGAVGALWVIFRADFSALLAFEVGRGEAVYFIGCVAHAIFTPLVRKLNRGEPAIVFTFGMLLAGSTVTTLWAWPELRAVDWVNLPAIVWITLSYVAGVATALTFVLMQFATLNLPSAKVMAYTYLVPSWVIMWEMALGHSVPQILVLGGVALTIFALLMLLRDET